MNLVLVESPTKARKLKEYLGKGYQVEASMGHVRDLPKSKLGVDVDNQFEPQYTVVAGRKAVVTKLKKLAEKSDTIYLATDPDREGEAIAWHLEYLLNDGKKKKSKTFLRSTFHEITKQAVTEALEHPSELNLNLVDAQQARRVVDRLVGYYLSPVLWSKIRRGLSAGRVQSVALRLIVEREKEREAFKPEEYWEVFSHVSFENIEFPVELFEVDGKKYEPHAEKDVTSVVSELESASYIVKSIEKNERKRSSLPPFTTSTLQQSAATYLGWGAKMTMQVAQQLYEEGLITYHRTDSTAIAKPALDAVRSHISSEYGDAYLPESPRFFKVSSKNAQEAHEAIRPTDPSSKQPQALGAMESKHVKLYELIWRRFVASQMSEAVYDQTSLTVSAYEDKYLLRTTGSILRFDGWTTLFPRKEDVLLPSVSEGSVLTFVRVEANQKFTQPPPRYNDASLIKTLEKLGIGRPSTYASIISVILDRGYVERKDKAFIPTVIGVTVLDFLVQHFPKELGYEFTAEMEDDLDAIARGEKKWKAVVKQFFTPFEKTVSSVKTDAQKSKIPVEETDRECPECKQGKLVIRTGRFGKFLSCSRFPECKHTEKLIETVDGMKCPECGQGDIVMKRTRRGKMFYGCSRYPACNYASWNKPTK